MSEADKSRKNPATPPMFQAQSATSDSGAPEKASPKAGGLLANYSPDDSAFDELMDKAQSQAPARSLVSIDDVGRATAFLALDGAKLITGGVTYIDGGYHIVD